MRSVTSIGRRLTLSFESGGEHVVVSVPPDLAREELEAPPRLVARDRPMRFGLLDART